MFVIMFYKSNDNNFIKLNRKCKIDLLILIYRNMCLRIKIYTFNFKKN